jgi:squalene-hopene/tetraprenyl-beta-curcumene cyclase
MVGDPASEDLTGRVLMGLGALGRHAGDSTVDKAIAFLKQQVYTNHGWFGRWECNFLPSTAYVLLGLAAVKAHEPELVRRAVEFLCSHQNTDGGFGESIDSYENLAFVGVGPSTAYTTGLVLSALVASGGPRGAIDRAAGYLVSAQIQDPTKQDFGLWSSEGYELVLLQPVPFYKIPADVWTAGLQGLADYGALLRGG